MPHGREGLVVKAPDSPVPSPLSRAEVYHTLENTRQEKGDDDESLPSEEGTNSMDNMSQSIDASVNDTSKQE